MARWAWVPIPLVLLTILALWAADLRVTFEAPFLVMVLNCIFRTLACLLIAWLAARSFLVRGSPGLLLLGCGVVAWGSAGAVVGALVGRSAHLSITISNLAAWLSGLCHLMSVVLSIRAKGGWRERGWWLLIGYMAAVGAVALVASATFAGWMPTFFVPGQGGTQVRYAVLGSAIAMFTISGIVLRSANGPARSLFAQWYHLALLLIAAGLFGAMLQSRVNNLLDWLTRGALWLSGVYMVMAFMASREVGPREISLGAAPRDARLCYALAFVFVAAAVVVRLAFLTVLGTRTVYITFFPAVILTALYGGRGPGLLAVVLAAIGADMFWAQPVSQLSAGDAADWLGMILFLGISTGMVFITAAMQQAQARATAAEAEVRLAAERQRAQEALNAANLELRRKVDELKTAEQALQQAHQELARDAENLERTVAERTVELRQTIGELEAFSYSLSHDMRAPLRAIQGFTQLVLQEQQEKLGATGTNFLTRVVHAAERMDRLILDVLTLTRLSGPPIEIRVVEVEALVRAITEERPELQPPNAEITVRSPLSCMRGHEASLAQCLTNLLGNAVKFVADGVKPQVRIWTEEVQKSRNGENHCLNDDRSPAPSPDSPVPSGWVRLWIEDNGIGIQAEQQQRIFELFHRLHSDKAYAGTGIGLAIVRKAVQRMGGEAGVESEPGRGSRFWVQLPGPECESQIVAGLKRMDEKESTTKH